MRFNNIIELGEFVDKVYDSVGGLQSEYNTLFQKIIGGCHCVPPTEWFGDIYILFNKMLNDKAISDKILVKQVEEVVIHFKNLFQ